MLKETSHIVGVDLNFLPLKTNAYIHEGNALRMDWAEVIAPDKLNYIMGNPPFVGASMMSAEQKEEAVAIFGKVKLSNSIDYVGAWYHLVAKMISQISQIKATLHHYPQHNLLSDCHRSQLIARYISENTNVCHPLKNHICVSHPHLPPQNTRSSYYRNMYLSDILLLAWYVRN
ncbi:MAG: hypothetical protein IJ756_05510 [Paludibacteraceae bacterium]|nr:hypothetical protein [Paludibacteraceae bacterium]